MTEFWTIPSLPVKGVARQAGLKALIFSKNEKSLMPTDDWVGCFCPAMEFVIFTNQRKELKMANNNTVTLTGNIGSEANIHIAEEGGQEFASFSLATTDSYKDDNEEWVQMDTIWHQVLVFNPRLVQMLKSLKKGTRIELTGSLSYRTFAAALDDGSSVQKKEVTVIGRAIELKPLAKKKTA